MERHSKQSSSEHYPRIRIAVLDTGYDPQAEFFVNRDRKIRLRGWKDWVAQSETPKDDDGHGSRVLSLLMKVAPMADIYVARIANNSSGLEHSSQFIANVRSEAVSSAPFRLTALRLFLGLLLIATRILFACVLVLLMNKL